MELLGRSRRKLGGAFAAGTAIQCVVGSTRARSHHNRVLSAGPTHCQPTSTENIRHYCTNYQFPRTATTTTIITATNSWRPQYLYRSHVPGHESVSAATTHLCNPAESNNDGSFELDLSQTSVQLAEYPGDGTSRYPRHCDVPKSTRPDDTSRSHRIPQRILTIIYYLTDPDWSVVHDGGCLRLFHDDSEASATTTTTANSSYTDVAPYAGRMVIFRSDGVEHAVQPCFRRPRCAVTIWLYGTQKRKQQQRIKIDTTNLLRSSRSKAESNTLNESLQPPLPYDLAQTTTEHEKSTIFVSIPSYRDSETGPTIRHLMMTARFAERIRVGLVLQIDTQQIGAFHKNSTTQTNPFHDQRDILDALPTQEPWWYARVRVLQMDARHATGPCGARALCQQVLYRGEQYLLQMDAHMRFRPNWDVYLIQQLQQCPDPTKAVLTTYPVGYTLCRTSNSPNNNCTTTLLPNETRGTFLVPWKFDNDDASGDGMLRIRGRLFREQLPRGRDEPVPCHLYAAGFNFCEAQGVLRDCPYDGSLHHLFFGEEMSMAVRLFTWGYDLLAPAQTVVYHLWERDHRPPPLSQLECQDAHAGNAAAKERTKALERVQKQLKGCGEGIGSVRTVLDFETVLGVNFDDLKILFTDNEYEIMRGVTFAKSASFGIDFFGCLGANTKSLILEFLG